MHKIILKIRELREQGAFKVSTRFLIVLLMALGLFVATMPLNASSIHNINDKLIHVLVFFGFAMLMDLTTDRKPSWLWKVLPLVGYGVIIEILQNMTDYRSFELADILADMIGVFSYFTLKALFKKLDRMIDKTK